MRLATFNPSKSRCVADSEDEQELMRLFRSVSQEGQARMLTDARRVLGQERRESLDIWMLIERLHSGRLRTFWCDVPRTFKDFRGGAAFQSLDDVRTTAEDVLEAFLVQRNITDEAETVFEAVSRESSNVYDFRVRRGRYRVEVNGLPASMVDAWIAC